MKGQKFLNWLKQTLPWIFSEKKPPRLEPWGIIFDKIQDILF